MHDKNAEICKVCDNTLDIIAVGVYLLSITRFPFLSEFDLSRSPGITPLVNIVSYGSVGLVVDLPWTLLAE